MAPFYQQTPLHLCAYFGHAGQVSHIVRGRGGAHADHRARQACAAQRCCGVDNRLALGLGTLDQRVFAAGGIAAACVGEHAAQFSPLAQRPADGDQRLAVIGQHARPVPIAVDLDQRRNGQPGLARGVGHGFGLRDSIQHHRQIDALLAQRHHFAQLVWRDADGIDHVRHAGSGKIRRLLQGGDRGRPCWRCHYLVGHSNRFGGLEVRA